MPKLSSQLKNWRLTFELTATVKDIKARDMTVSAVRINGQCQRQIK